MKNIRYSRLFAIALVALSLLAFGCKQPEDLTTQDSSIINALQGTWVEAGSSGNSYYKIEGSTFKNYGDTYTSYEGEDLEIEKISDTAGTIFIKYTVSMNADYTYSSTAPDVGKWYAISYKNLTDNSVSLSGAYGKLTSTDTLEEAKKEFTIENGYFASYSECKKAE